MPQLLRNYPSFFHDYAGPGPVGSSWKLSFFHDYAGRAGGKLLRNYPSFFHDYAGPGPVGKLLTIAPACLW